MERFEHWCLGDFVRSNSAGLFEGDPSATWRSFETEAGFVERRLETLQQQGVRVVFKADCASIRDAAASADNVILLAHWKHERVFPFDILSPRPLLEYLLTHDLRAVQTMMPVPHAPDKALCERISLFLDDAVIHGDSPLVAVSAEADDGRLPIAVLRREMLNAVPGLAQGNRLETWDALISASEFSALFGANFNGTAMLAICYSTLIAETFRLRHPRALCIANGDLTNAGINLMRLSAAITLMRTKRIALWDALLRVSSMIDDLTKRRR
ncbi:hypothetical protein LJR029_006382 [Caballeronia sp. LjRoot29]|uniref:hypothetical protein n=1 Tax=Caballeronia sp. LjRoot29 TaxID=3342315 RepID=UPI003ECE41CD